ncbi:MAG TPA: anhydro-N-acetylmuramic acid kinase [Bellilinea sp.]|nr:anhydro-N-acetylmuramic acid kinase [Bellilinea sp.]
MRVIGLMSGTSADGVDAVLAEIHGAPPKLAWRILSHTHIPYPADLQQRILDCTQPETSSAAAICALNFELGAFYASVVEQTTNEARIPLSEIDLIGSHGQTIWHIPEGELRSTLQIGEPAILAERTGIPVVSDFRPRDIAAGGQGAPLVAYVDALLFRDEHKFRALQNIGGIGNVTFLPPLSRADEPVLAFDTGPGNMLIDDAMRRMTNKASAYDEGGKTAASGKVNIKLLLDLLGDPYFNRKPPKTTGREYFGHQFAERVWQAASSNHLAEVDTLATIPQLTASSIAQAYHSFLPHPPDEVILSGGGARNTTLVQMIAEQLPHSKILRIDDLGIKSEEKEAFAFAILAYETWHNRPGNLPAATGATHPVVLGNITPGRLAGTDQTDATEARNSRTKRIDQASTREMVELMNLEDKKVALAVETQLGPISEAIDAISQRMREGGRLIYIGAGTSGRMGVLDASECPPTFNTSPELVKPLIAGGPKAILESVEGAEDDESAGEKDVRELGISNKDSLIGIAASGRTPYVLGGMRAARSAGALVISLASNHPSVMAEVADIVIAPIVGPEVITGSTRLKAGTAQKMVLNMISTGVMIKLGKTFGNLMVDVQKTNDKLRSRAINIVAEATGLSENSAKHLLDRADGEVKLAIVSHLAGISLDEARNRLSIANGVVRKALEVTND